MNTIAKRSLCLLLTLTMLLSCMIMGVSAAEPTSGTSTVTGVASDQWKQALTNQKLSFTSPYEAKDNPNDEYFDKIGTGHLQGMCVDDDLRYMYVSYTNGIGKIDMQTGEVAGYLTGFDSGLHIGCLAYYDGHIYGSFEAQATHKFYIIQVDESQFWGVMDTREKWLDAVRVILLWEPTVDARDLMGDDWDNGDGIAGRSEEVGHRYSNAGIDGVTFGTYPGEFGKADADVYMFVSYGTYWFTNGDTKLSNRLDDEHIILQAYNTKDFLNEANNTQYLLELAYTDTTTPDQNGVANARSIYYAEDSILHAEKALFCFVGNTQWGCQQIEFDRSTGDIWLSTYGASDGSPVKGSTWHVVDGSKAPQNKEIQLGQNADASKLIYGDLGEKTDAQKAAIVEAAKARATRYSNNTEKNSTWDTWEYHPNGSDTTKHFSGNGYPMADIPYMKCVCGDNCHTSLEGKGDYIGYTAENGYDVDHMICCGKSQNMYMGLVSLGNGYWYWNDGGGNLELYHMDGWSSTNVGTATKVTASNVESYKTADLGSITDEEEAIALTKMVARAEKAYPANAQGDYSDESWTALQTAITNAKAASTPAEVTAAKAALRTALNGLRKTADIEELAPAITSERSRITAGLYDSLSYKTFDDIMKGLDDLSLSGENVSSQTKLDYAASEYEKAINSLLLLSNLETTKSQDLTDTWYSENNVKDGGWQILHVVVPTGKTVAVVADDIVIRTLTAGTYNVPIANVNTLNIVDASVSTYAIRSNLAAAGVSGYLASYQDARTIAGIEINGKEIYGFDANTLTYTTQIPTTGTPEVTVKALEDCDATWVIGAIIGEGDNLSVTITVTTKAGTTVVYTVNMVRDASQNDTVIPVTATDVWATDVTPLWCTTYPNRRGLDGKDERFMIKKGWTNPDNQSAPDYGTNATLGGGFTEGFTLHAITFYGMPESYEELGFAGKTAGTNKTQTANDGTNLHNNWVSTYTTRFQSATSTYYFKGLDETAAAAAAQEYYSSVSFDVTKYTNFSATVKSTYTDGNANSTLRVYLDGVLQETTYKIVGGSSYELNLDLTGVSRMTLQLDPENDGTPGNPKDWANRDVVVFGNAKFTKPTYETEEVYVSDIADSEVLWATSYPNRRGADGTNERFMRDQGWQYDNNLTDDTKLIGVDANGNEVTYTKGFTMHGITSYGMKHGEPELNSDGSGKSDSTIKQKYVSTNNLEQYSSIAFDVTNYERFTTTLSIADAQKGHQNASGTIRFYTDGELVQEMKFSGTTYATEIDLDLTNVSRLTVQVDPENSDGIGNSDDWAHGDIITFGNAKFTKVKTKTTTVYLDTVTNAIDNTTNNTNAPAVHWLRKNQNQAMYDTDGTSSKTYSHNLVIEPLVNAQVTAAGSTESAYREAYVNGTDGKKYIDYSSVTWDIAGKGYTAFQSTVGVRYGNEATGGSRNADVKINFYVDGTLKKAITFLGGGAANPDVAAKDVTIDLTGAKTFTIQVDPYGQGVQKMDDYANQDITIFGDARFTTTKLVQAPDTVVEPTDTVTYLSDMSNDQHTTATIIGSAAYDITNTVSGVHFMNKNSNDNTGIYGTDGQKQTFTKYLRFEPLIAEQVGKVYGLAKDDARKQGKEAEYRNLYVNGTDGKKYMDYSSVTFNIPDGTDYFAATVGTRYNNSAYVDATVNFYLDGVLVEGASINFLGTSASESDVRGKEVFFETNGAKKLTIQIDPYGQGKLQTTTTNSTESLPDFARQDILIFGNARFVDLANKLSHTHEKDTTKWVAGENGHWHACKSCDEHLDYAAHTYGTDNKCIECGQPKSVSATHTLQYIPALPASCTTDGNVEYWYCTECNTYFLTEDCNTMMDGPEDAKIAAHHTLTHVAYKAPTYAEAGNIEYWHCESCQKNFSDDSGTTEITGSVILDKLVPTIVPSTSTTTTTKPAATKLPFTDVASDSWYYESVKSAYEKNLINGLSADEFSPESSLTVAQAIKLASALHQMKNTGSVTLENGEPWYSSYVDYAVTNGILEESYSSYTAAQLNAPATRAEFVHILHGAMNYYAKKNTVADNAIPDVKLTDTYGEEIYDFYRSGILTGFDEEGTFLAKNSIRRCEVATILVRMYDVTARQSITLK